MILQALKEYYDRKASDSESGIAPLGWKVKEIPFLLVLNASGELCAIEDTREKVGKKEQRAKSFILPQPAKRTVNIAANLLWDNVEYVLGIPCKGKVERVKAQHESFLNRLSDYSDFESVKAILKFLNNTAMVGQLEKFEQWKELKEKRQDISFKMAGEAHPVFNDAEITKRINKAYADASGEKSFCLVSGIQDEPARLHPAIKGVQGCKKNGGKIVSFNFAATNSFHKKQGMNSPIGEQAAFAYTTALNTLLGKDSIQKLTIGDATTVFWSEKKTTFEAVFPGFWAESPKDDPDRLVNAVATLYRSVDSGTGVPEAEDATRFYILGLSPSAARISVRFWQIGSVAELSLRFREYFDDLDIARSPNDKQHLSLSELLISTAAPGNAKNISKNISPNLAGETMRCILAGLPLPETLLQAAIRRVKIVQKDKKKQDMTYARAKLIKGCLNRKLRFNNPQNERSLTVSLDKENTSIGYRLGRLFAVFEKIQLEANPGINATIRDKFYASASSTPSTVFGNLMRLKNHHLAKLDNRGRRVNFEKMLGEIIDALPPAFPAHLDLDGQGRFAIGYYHQCRVFWTKKTDTENV